jgi:glucose/arabinose dehydrogenase
LAVTALVAIPVGVGTPQSGPLADPLRDVPTGPVVAQLELVASGLRFPTHAAAPPDGSGRIFVCEVDGVIRVVEDGALSSTPFADLSADYQPSNGSATSSLAFHPDFASNQRLYVVTSELEDPLSADFGVTTDVRLQSVLYELRAQAAHPAPGSGLVDPASRRELLRINEESTIHNLNALAFGPDGYLYLAKGDDRTGGQDLATVHGTVMRIDVDLKPGNQIAANGEYAIPADNPFVGAAGALAEIFAYGFRNPWRMSFDRASGALWVADVGEDDVEEIDLVVWGGNDGWGAKEGGCAVLPGGGVTSDLSGLPPGPFVDPVGQYDHGQGDRSVTGGVVYRGRRHPELRGRYVFADWISGRLFSMDPASGAILGLPVDPRGEVVRGHLSGPPTEGVIGVFEDADGELLLVVTQRNTSPTGRLLRPASLRPLPPELALPWQLPR